MREKKIKVMHVLNTNQFSGAEKVVIEVINNSSDSFEMYYCSPNGSINKVLKKNKIKHVDLSSLKSKDSFRKAIDSIKPDVIHAHDIRATFFSVLYSKGIPIVSHLHGNSDKMKKVSIKSIMYLYSSFFVKHIIAVSNSVLRDYKYSKYIYKKTSVLYNFIDKNNLLNYVNKDKKTYNFDFVYLGRLSFEKNPLKIAEIASSILKIDKKVKFAVIGEGPYKNEMENIFRHNGVISQVEFIGFIENPYKILSTSKFMIMCSKFEGTPMAAIEAIHLKVPIITYPTDGLNELIIHGENGYFAKNDSEFKKYAFRIFNENLQVQQTENELMNSEKYNKKLEKVYWDAINNK